jgi:1-acyl-sn-glycerol-3-phosphate acyltransferase
MQQLLNRFYRCFFLGWFWLGDRLFFHQQRWQEAALCAHKPVLLLANHISWWDGAWMFLHNAGYWKRRFKVLMLEAELQKRPFLAALGAIGLGKGREQLQCLSQLTALAQDAQNLLLIFPEGAIQSAHQSLTKFETALIRRLDLSEWQVVFVYSAVEYLNQPRPTRFHFVEPCETNDYRGLSTAYSAFKAKCQAQLATEITRSMRQWP